MYLRMPGTNIHTYIHTYIHIMACHIIPCVVLTIFCFCFYYIYIYICMFILFDIIQYCIDVYAYIYVRMYQKNKKKQTAEYNMRSSRGPKSMNMMSKSLWLGYKHSFCPSQGSHFLAPHSVPWVKHAFDGSMSEGSSSISMFLVMGLQSDTIW